MDETASRSAFDDLEAEGAAAAPAPVAPSEATAPAEDPTICRRGPCQFFIDTQFPTGIEVREGTVLANQRCFCRAGVLFEERKADSRTSLIIGSSFTLPIDCSMWSPMTAVEMAERDQRRLEEQDRHAMHLEAEAARAAAVKESP